MWIEAIVMPREQPTASRPSSRQGGKRPAASAPARSRAAVDRQAGEESQQFRDTVLGFLRARELMSAVRWVSEPGLFPLVTLHCTRGVLEQLRKEPGFEAGLSMPLELMT
ncbi:hypothetical protein FJV41_03275 [Myxococcus llanfairpwllgwyngyllgogerychwyrndrobwllllantysiliogogogochensis]|uniref:Uncharacterized protein n=1 Tax=Myxococcus llanfairpwllgwyngyllgogerychwyrndrobwllllantysiliogogogochensis TaxID=2590453 RepID=A0A540X846_9BACT|nr:hypothetical protein FJV41_03275 [Myxococcus llanfairpwllgwyngyllgogerychwyrndrobwllllantysiliogogogochensis]